MINSIKNQLIFIGIAIVIFTVIFTSWGLDDIDGLLAHPARLALLLLLLILFTVLGLFVPSGGITQSSRQPIHPGVENNHLIAFIGAMGILLFLMVSPFSDRNEWMLLIGGDLLRYLGLFIFILGAGFSIWTSIHISKQWNIQHGNQQPYHLITNGPFKLVRHPRDLGNILIFIGIPLVFRSSLGLLLAFLSVAGLFERISREEKVLQQQFKDEWSKYAEKTKCLIPWIEFT